MKKLWTNLSLILILLAMYNCSNSQKYSEGYTIRAQITGASNQQVKLVKLDLETNEPVVVDSTKINNNKFLFEGFIESPYLHSILIEDSPEKIHLFLENSRIDISTDIKNLSSAAIAGSREDSLFRSYEMDDIFDRTKGLNIILNHFDYSYAAFAAYYLFQVQNIHLDTLDLIMNSFSPAVTKTEYYKHLLPLYKTLRKTSIGQPAPNFDMPDTQGGNIKLIDFRGQFVLLDFWASWCAPCREANPTLVSIYEKFKGNNFSIIGISVDKDKESWLKAIKSDGLVWPNLSNLTGWDTVSAAYGVKAIPQNFLIDPQGIIVEKNLEPGRLSEALSTYLR